MSRCKGCDAELVWIRSASGKPIPCDPKELAIVTEDGRVVTGRIAHFATCSKVNQFRRPKAATTEESHTN